MAAGVGGTKVRYIVKCSECGRTYEVELDFTPKFCLKCGATAEITPTKTKARVTAEARMAMCEELRPRMEEAWENFAKLRVEYEDSLVFLAQYHKRKIISQEEYDRYRIRTQNYKLNINEAVKEYRKEKAQK